MKNDLFLKQLTQLLVTQAKADYTTKSSQAYETKNDTNKNMNSDQNPFEIDLINR